MNKTIAVIGLGKLGSCLLAFYADRGFRTIGVDINPEIAAAINKGAAPVVERGLAELIRKNKKRISATTEFPKAVTASDISFIIVPTPSDKTGRFSTKFVESAAKEVGAAVSGRHQYHLVVLVSTVLSEDCRRKVIPALEKLSGKKCGSDFGFCYSPLLVAIGDVLKNLAEPDFIFVGQYDKKSGDRLSNFYKKIYGANANLKRMSLESAELAKLALNSFLTMKITFANTLGLISEKLPNANVDEITSAIGDDKRIGRGFLKSGLGYGGTCFPRDNLAFAWMARNYGVEAKMAKAVHQLNEEIPQRVVRELRPHLQKKNTVGVCGLSYKPGTPVAEESQGVKIATLLASQKISVVVYDPLGYADAKKYLGNKVGYCQTLEECVQKSNLLILANIEPEFQKIPRHKIIIDPWRQLK